VADPLVRAQGLAEIRRSILEHPAFGRVELIADCRGSEPSRVASFQKLASMNSG
jgi:hypothetical protein